MKTTQSRNYQSLACMAAFAMTFGATGISEVYAGERASSTDSSPVMLDVVENPAEPTGVWPWLLAVGKFAYDVGKDVGGAAAKWWYAESTTPPVAAGNPIMTPQVPSKVVPMVEAPQGKPFLLQVQKGSIPSGYDSETKLTRATPEFLLDG